MTLNRMSALWARTSLLWFVLTVGLGLYMGMSGQFQFMPAHAHIGVLGWLSSGVFAFLYAIAREARPGSIGGMLHWAAHLLGTAAMTAGLFGAIGLGHESLMGVVRFGALLVVASAVGGTILLWPGLAPRD